MPKVVLADLSNFSSAALAQINSNNQRIEDGFDNTLSRDGTIPNQMGADIDMNENDILNVDNIDVDTLEVETLILNGREISSSESFINFPSTPNRYIRNNSSGVPSALGATESANLDTLSDVASGTAGRDILTAAGTDDAREKQRSYKTVAALLASTRPAGGTGTRWQAGGYLYDEADSGASDHDITTAGGQKLYTLVLDPRAFGCNGLGTVDDAPAFNRLIARINLFAASGKGISVTIPAGTYNLKAGGLAPILTSDIEINCSNAAIFLLRDGPVWKLGDNSTTASNIWINGGQPRVEIGDTPHADCAWIFGVNCARIYAAHTRIYRLPHIFKGVSTTTLATITIRSCTGFGMPEYGWVDIDTSGNPSSVAAGLFIQDCTGAPFVPPTNPAVVPKAVTGVTQANPAVVTVANHGYATGKKVRFAGIVGMTELNGNTYTVTSINANTFSIGVDSTGYGAYASDGRAVELHWSDPYDGSVVRIKGHWDTAVITGGLLQHYAWLWRLEADGVISFIWDENVCFDYGGKGRFYVSLNAGGSLSNVRVNDGWHWCMNEDWIEIDGAGAGAINDLTVQDHCLGMTGGSFIDDYATSKITNLNVSNLRVVGVGRARRGAAYIVRQGSSGPPAVRINKIVCENPVNTYGGGTNYLIADTGVRLNPSMRYSIGDCELYASGTHYDIPSNSSVGPRYRTITKNRKRDGSLPEYIVAPANISPASGATNTNYTGLTQRTWISGGTVSDIKLNGVTIYAATGCYFDVAPGETWSVTFSSAPAVKIAYMD